MSIVYHIIGNISIHFLILVILLFAGNFPTYLVSAVEVLDPMVLSSRVAEACEPKECGMVQIPGPIQSLFDNELVMNPSQRRLYVTLGQFSIIRLERDAQLIVPVLDYALPTKECCDTPGATAEDPCEMFSRIPFPTQQFTPTGCDKHEHCCD